MRKTLLLAAILVLVVAMGWLLLPKLAANLAGRAGSSLAGAPFTVGSLSVNPISGRASISDLELQTLPPFEAAFVARVGRVDARFDRSTLTGDFVLIHEVVIDSAEVVVEQRGTALNVTDLAGRIERYVAQMDTTSGTRVFVEELRFINARGTLLSEAGQRSFAIGNVVLRDLGSPTSGTPLALLVVNLINPLLNRTLADAGLPVSQLGVGDTGLGQRVKGLFGK